MADPAIDEAAVRAKYPQLAWALDIPELKMILFDAATRGLQDTELQGSLFGTVWWKQHSASNRLWQQLLAQDPASARERMDQEARLMDNTAKSWGIVFHGLEAYQLADRKLRYGLNDDQMKLELGRYLRSYRREHHSLPQGAARLQGDAYRQMGAQYLIPLDKATTQKFAIQKMEGRITDEYVQSYFVKQAKTKFAWMADDIDRGATPESYFAPHKQSLSDLWEVSGDEINLMNDPELKAVTNYVDPETGKTRGMSINELENFARRNKRWETTDNARQASSELGNQLLETFGKIAK